MKYRFPHRLYGLASLVQELGTLTHENLHMMLYSWCRHYSSFSDYHFVTLDGKPFSFQAQEDWRFLVQKAIAQETMPLSLHDDIRFARYLNMLEKLSLQRLCNDLKAGCVTMPPPDEVPSRPHEQILYTIGYEGRTIDAYINLLRKQDVAVLCDVRRHAFSQKFGFNKQELTFFLPQCGILYYHLPALGIASDKRSDAKAIGTMRQLLEDYDAYLHAQGDSLLAPLLDYYHRYQRVAITCFEAHTHSCHRSKIAARLHQQHGMKVVHL